MKVLSALVVLALLLTAGPLGAAPGAESAGMAGGGGGELQPQAGPPPVTIRHLRSEEQLPEPRIHPPVRLLDPEGRSVVASGGPLALARTCGGCHDTRAIAAQNYHALAGLDERFAPGAGPSGRPWDTSPGMFGRWNPLTYRLLSPRGDRKLDLGTAEWVMTMGPRHVGGGPAAVSRDSGTPLTDPSPAAGADPETQVLDPETQVLDPETGLPVAWNWQESGTTELNCLICHLRNPDNLERVQTIRAGRFRWASTATLAATGLVEKADGGGFRWLPAGFDAQGHPTLPSFRISDPESGNCRLCHGKACRCSDPVVFQNSLENWSTETTGEVFSPERVRESGMNLQGKERLTLPWDAHAERLFGCTDCHPAMNNPATAEKEAGARPRHLAFDARRVSINDYLVRPDHNFAKGTTAQGTVARGLDGTARNCRDCHDAEAIHDFLPFRRLHFERLACQACHVPQVHAPARAVTDWTLISPQGEPRLEHRGVEGSVNDPASLITGYRPALLMCLEDDGKLRLGPHNLISSWFWVEGDPERPVRLADLEHALVGEAGEYRPEVAAVLDRDRDGRVGAGEVRLDSADGAAAVKARLESVGVDRPRIRAEIQPYSLSHGVAAAAFALGDCQECHSPASRITADTLLAGVVPAGVFPEPVADSGVQVRGEFRRDGQGRLALRPSLDPDLLYIHGSGRLRWMDTAGILALAGSGLGVGVHGVLRFLASRSRKKRQPGRLRRVHFYTVYERLWHWTQAAAIVVLIVTGLAVTWAGLLSAAGFTTAVEVHNVVGLVLAANAFLALFYNLAAGLVRRYVPGLDEVLSLGFKHASYYLLGIFRGEPHPFDKTPEKRLLPLQKITYFVVLSLLLPLMIVTGLLKWSAVLWPDLIGLFGGLDFVAPVHRFGAWLLAAFLIVHVYMITTGRTVWSSLKAMLTGYEEVEEETEGDEHAGKP